MPPTARRTLAKVNSSAITARHPDVPNLICVSMIMPQSAMIDLRRNDDNLSLGQAELMADS